MTTEDFIIKANWIHNNKYDYSKAEYIKSSLKVCIICPEHGEFWQIANDHLMGHGCSKCGGTKRITTKEFVEKAKQVHGDKYDYSKVEYINAHAKVCIICPEHGEFWQRSGEHVKGQGCPKCYGLYKTTEEFIKQAKQIHGDKYDYSKVEYKGSKAKVCIICPEHGEFWQVAQDHLVGKGCAKCFGRGLSTEDFTAKAKQIHGDKYDYSKVEYTNINTKVCIICPEHGEFWQVPRDHFDGCGCPICKESQGEKRIRVWCEQNGLLLDKDYIIQYRPNWLGRQSIDFFFPKINLGIEYDGRQHFELVNWKHAVSLEEQQLALNDCKERDERKNQLCANHDIKLIRIPYTEYDNIEQILCEKLQLTEVKK